VMSGLRVDDRELLLTTVIDARPDAREPSPEDSIWPLVSAIAVTILFIGSIFTPWALVYATPFAAAALIAWFWPRKLEPDPEPVI
ncbi:MAG: cytochrome oxidase, partial [Alphaproteobacteria bacterium]|nr:cytochrome oxidase [Alphaproteobacteria bacterium]